MENRNTLYHNLTKENVAEQLIAFAAPLFLSGLLQTVYTMVDTIIVGRYVGKEGLAAVSVGGEVLVFLTFIASGFSNAGQIIISQYIGAQEYEKVKRMVGTMFSFLLVISVGITVVCFFLHEKILVWLHMPEIAMEEGNFYILVCILGLVFIYGYNLVSAVLRGMGDSKHPLYFIAIASGINVILDFLFVVGLHMGTMGAALATVMGQAFSFLWALRYLYSKRNILGLDLEIKSLQSDREAFSLLMRLGIPMALQTAAITFSKLFITTWVNTYGVEAAAVAGIGNKLQTLTNVFAQALSTAAGLMIAQNIGAEKYNRVPKIIHTSFALDGVVTAFVFIITVLFPSQIFGIFTHDQQVLELCLTYTPVALLLYAGCILRPTMNALINGSGNTKLNLIIALLDGMIARIGLAYLLGKKLEFGVYGFWYGNALSGFVPFLIGMPYYLSGKWKNHIYVQS